MGIKYEKQNRLPEEQRFFANRVRKYVENPEQDKELEEEIREGKYPELKCLLPEQSGSDVL